MKLSYKHNEQEVINLFWSGGWDSTFRLLQLLLEEKKIVQPHYIIWSGETIGETIEAMQKIRAKIFLDFPEAHKLLLPINYFDNFGLIENKTISNAFDKLEKKHRVGIQHAKLAQFCDQINLNYVEQGTEKNSHSHQWLKEYMSGYVVDKEKSPKIVYDIFKYFRFPLVEYEKKDMDKISIENKWEDIMYMTWFCRRPINGKPCGFCGNCTDTLLHGMGKRLPLRARIIAYLQLPFRKWWRNNYQKQDTGIFKFVRYMLRNKA